jgi:hypothetical protein
MSARRYVSWRALALALLATVLALAACAPAPTPTSQPAAPPTSGPVGDPLHSAVLTWERQGGIAGFCDQLNVFADGSVAGRTCKGSMVQEGTLTAEQRAQLQAWLTALRPFEYTKTDPAVADAMTVRLTFAGSGTTRAGAADQQAVVAFAEDVYAGLMPVAGPTPTPEVFSPVPEDARAADAARDALARQLGVSAEAMTVKEVSAQDWPDSCLGLAKAGEMCAQVITPGYRVVLTVDGREYELRTNLAGTVVRIAGQE